MKGKASGGERPAPRSAQRSGRCRVPAPSRPRPAAHHTHRKRSVLPELVRPALRLLVAFRRRPGQPTSQWWPPSRPPREQPMTMQSCRKLFRPDGVSTDALETPPYPTPSSR